MLLDFGAARQTLALDPAHAKPMYTGLCLARSITAAAISVRGRYLQHRRSIYACLSSVSPACKLPTCGWTTDHPGPGDGALGRGSIPTTCSETIDWCLTSIIWLSSAKRVFIVASMGDMPPKPARNPRLKNRSWWASSGRWAKMGPFSSHLSESSKQGGVPITNRVAYCYSPRRLLMVVADGGRAFLRRDRGADRVQTLRTLFRLRRRIFPTFRFPAKATGQRSPCHSRLHPAALAGRFATDYLRRLHRAGQRLLGAMSAIRACT